MTNYSRFFIALVIAPLATLQLSGCGEPSKAPVASAPLPEAQAPKAPVLTASGYAAIQFGMPLSAAETATKETLTPDAGTLDCTYVNFNAYPGISFMVERGIITRADASADIENGAGVKLGSTIDQIKMAHPAIEVQPHKYEPDGNNLVLAGTEANSAYVFEAKSGRVTSIRAGIKPAVLYVERCG